MLKRCFVVVILLMFAVGLFGGAALAVGEVNFAKGVAVRDVTLTLQTVDRHDFTDSGKGAKYIFRPTANGEYMFHLTSTMPDYEVSLFILDENNKVTGKVRDYSSDTGSLIIRLTLKRSVRYMLVVGKSVSIARDGRVSEVDPITGVLQAQVMYCTKGHVSTSAISLSTNEKRSERIRTPYQTDFYRFEAPYDATYTFNTTGSVWLRFFDEHGVLQGESRTRKMSKGETCIVRLNRRDSKTGGYSIFAELSQAQQEIPVKTVKLNAGKKELSKDKSFRLSAQIAPSFATEREVKWESSNPNVASVDENGLVKAVAPGFADIKATCTSGASAVCTIKVKGVAVKSVDIRSKLTLKTGNLDSLIVKFKPANASIKDVTWTSSNENVVKVNSDGKVIAVAPGKAKITVVSKDGKKKDTCTITVTKP